MDRDLTRRAAEASGIVEFGKVAHVEQESLYRALSPQGNPRLSTLLPVIRELGMTLTVEGSL